MRNRKKKTNIIPIILLVVFFGLFCFSGYMALSEIISAKHEAEAFDSLAEQVRQKREQAQQPPSTPEASDPTQVPEQTPSTPEENMTVADIYGSLHEDNPDFFGWIMIEGTVLDYPVMFTPTEPERYLRRSFDGAHATSGVPFLDGKYFDGCYNYLIYGHNMKNGTMFASILNYEKKSYWNEHPIIQFDTLDGTGSYLVIAAFYTEVYPQDVTDVFKYYYFLDLSDPDRYDEYITQVKAAATYDTGLSADYGTQLLTLSTCSYNIDNGRFVVVAKKIS